MQANKWEQNLSVDFVTQKAFDTKATSWFLFIRNISNGFLPAVTKPAFLQRKELRSKLEHQILKNS